MRPSVHVGKEARFERKYSKLGHESDLRPCCTPRLFLAALAFLLRLCLFGSGDVFASLPDSSIGSAACLQLPDGESELTRVPIHMMGADQTS